MQFNDPQWILKDRGFSITWTTVRSIVLITCLIIIYLRKSQEEFRLMVIVSYFSGLSLSGLIAVMILLILAPVNWTIEEWEWQYLTDKFLTNSLEYCVIHEDYERAHEIQQELKRRSL